MTNETLQKNQTQTPSSGFLHLLINIFIPVYILNKGHNLGLSAQNAVLLALAFPLVSGIYSAIKEKKPNFISLLGLLNILISGTLTLLGLNGIWFAVKEAAFPLLISIFVFFSSFSKNPFFETLFLNPNAFNTTLIHEKIERAQKVQDFKSLMQRSTRWLSLSFVMSAVLNFGLAIYIFKPIDDAVVLEQKQILLNQQLSQMTLYSTIVILVPSFIFLGVLLFFTFKSLQHLTGLKTEELLLADSKS